MASDDILSHARMLIGDLRQQTSPDVPSPEDVCRYVALHLGISDESARDLIVRAALRDAEGTSLPR
jgi:hypothetical protein